MRDEADTISAVAMSRRLPVPASDDEIGRLAETLNRMLDRLESASVRQRQFVSDASHELKTPLAIMRTMLEVAAEDPGFDDWPGLMAGLKREEERMNSLVGDLLTLARFDEGAIDTHNEVHLDQVLGRVVERTKGTYPAIKVSAAGIDAVRVYGDPNALERLFTNLGMNAGRFAETGVEFSCTERNGSVIAEVLDDGQGIPTDDRERIFERFVRLDESRERDAGGTGLGLAVARAIARAHGGGIRVADSDSGTRIEVMLPGVDM